MTTYYTYLIGWPDIDRWYYGVRTGNKVLPEEDFWIHYFTSSKIVEQLRKDHGDPPIKQIRRRFVEKTEAKIWKVKF